MVGGNVGVHIRRAYFRRGCTGHDMPNVTKESVGLQKVQSGAPASANASEHPTLLSCSNNITVILLRLNKIHCGAMILIISITNEM